jgi:hypothetical protein
MGWLHTRDGRGTDPRRFIVFWELKKDENNIHRPAGGDSNPGVGRLLFSRAAKRVQFQCWATSSRPSSSIVSPAQYGKITGIEG